MGYLNCYNRIKKLIESEEFKEMNAKWNPNDPQSALSLALKELYKESKLGPTIEGNYVELVIADLKAGGEPPFDIKLKCKKCGKPIKPFQPLKMENTIHALVDTIVKHNQDDCDSDIETRKREINNIDYKIQCLRSDIERYAIDEPANRKAINQIEEELLELEQRRKELKSS